MCHCLAGWLEKSAQHYVGRGREGHQAWSGRSLRAGTETSLSGSLLFLDDRCGAPWDSAPTCFPKLAPAGCASCRTCDPAGLQPARGAFRLYWYWSHCSSFQSLFCPRLSHPSKRIPNTESLVRARNSTSILEACGSDVCDSPKALIIFSSNQSYLRACFVSLSYRKLLSYPSWDHSQHVAPGAHAARSQQ